MKGNMKKKVQLGFKTYSMVFFYNLVAKET